MVLAGARLPRARPRRSRRSPRNFTRPRATSCFPRVMRDYSTARVLTTEWMDGAKVADLGAPRRRRRRPHARPRALWWRPTASRSSSTASITPIRTRGTCWCRARRCRAGAAIVFLDFGATAECRRGMRKGMVSFLQGAMTRDTAAHRLGDEGHGLHLAAGRSRGLRSGRRVLPRPVPRRRCGRRLLAQETSASTRSESLEQPARPAQTSTSRSPTCASLPRPQGMDPARADAAPAARGVHHARSGDEPHRGHPAVPRAVLARREEGWSEAVVEASREVALSALRCRATEEFHRPRDRGELELRFAASTSTRACFITAGNRFSGGCSPSGLRRWPRSGRGGECRGRRGQGPSVRGSLPSCSCSPGSPVGPAAAARDVDAGGSTEYLMQARPLPCALILVNIPAKPLFVILLVLAAAAFARNLIRRRKDPSVPWSSLSVYLLVGAELLVGFKTPSGFPGPTCCAALDARAHLRLRRDVRGTSLFVGGSCDAAREGRTACPSRTPAQSTCGRPSGRSSARACCGS